jgi:acid phosphatase type 7
MSTPTYMQIRWRTDLPTATVVKYGTSANALNFSVSATDSKTEHITNLNNLIPNTKYFYSLETSTKVLKSGTDYFFITPPPTNTTQKIRVWANGDCGNATERQTKVRDAFLKTLGDNYLNLWILLGDNTYFGSDDAAYEKGFFGIYAKDKFLRQSPFYPATGNHDYDGVDRIIENPKLAYYDIFSMPTKGEAGGVASGSKGYYSYDYGNIHFVVLESEAVDKDNKRLYEFTPNNQTIWLEKDLAANKQMWTVVYFHHPPFTKGSHNSDSEPDLTAIREKIVPIFEKYKVDLVLNGHTHAYERSKPMKGYYGLSENFDEKKYVLETSSGKWDNSINSCPYTKNQAPLYVVAGSAGGYGTPKEGYPHKSMYYSYVEKGGSLYFEVENNGLSAQFISEDGLILDKFSILKNVNKSSNIKLFFEEETMLNPSWKGDYIWNNTLKNTQAIKIKPQKDTLFIVKDKFSCIADTFRVEVEKLVGQYDIKYLHVQRIQNGVKLEWDVTQQKNIQVYEVEKSTDGITYKSIGKVKATGQKNKIMALAQYRYIDKTASSELITTVYYRLKSLDWQNTSKYSKILNIDVDLDKSK